MATAKTSVLSTCAEKESTKTDSWQPHRGYRGVASAFNLLHFVRTMFAMCVAWSLRPFTPFTLRKIYKFTAALILVLCSGLAMSQVSDSRNAPIVFESGFLSVDARQVRLGNLFSDISAKAGIAIINQLGLTVTA